MIWKDDVVFLSEAMSDVPLQAENQHISALQKTILEDESGYAAFIPHDGTAEFFLILNSSEAHDFGHALEALYSRFEGFLGSRKLSGGEIVFSRLYVSDIANQDRQLTTSKLYLRLCSGAISVIEQRPLNRCAIALFAYFATPVLQKQLRNSGMAETRAPSQVLVVGKHYRMLWLANCVQPGLTDAKRQMDSILEHATLAMTEQGMRWLPNALRSWIFIRDIDDNYLPMVQSRRAFFESHGLTDQTRTLASTGIEGRFAHPESRVGMDLLCMDGLDTSQISKMEAPECLSPASQYGATFERGLRVDFGDRAHLHLSGTASIDQNGEILHTGNVEKQTQRTLENLQALLLAQGSSFSDLAYVLVYLRDASSLKIVRSKLQQHLPVDIPRLFLEAGVCRPGWLVEIEGLAFISQQSQFKPFL